MKLIQSKPLSQEGKVGKQYIQPDIQSAKTKQTDNMPNEGPSKATRIDKSPIQQKNHTVDPSTKTITTGIETKNYTHPKMVQKAGPSQRM